MMGSASLQFVAYGLLIGLISNFGRSVAWRQAVLLAASLGFLAFFSLNLWAWIPLMSFLALGFIGVRLTWRTKRGFVPFLTLGILAFIWLKKYAFLPSSLFLTHPYVTIGLSYIFFRVLHLLIDAHGDNLPERMRLASYLNYTLNFTTFVSGPIQFYQDFARMQCSDPPRSLNVVIAGRSIGRIIVGFFKVNVLSLFLSMAQTSALESLSLASSSTARVLAATVIVAVYPLYLYANFSGYIDIVIGIARFLRIELPENFDRPFSSKSFLIFWSRWHMTLSNWLKTYVFNPLVIACMRRWPSTTAEPLIVVFAFFFTFILIGVWHGQTSEFLFYGIVLGLGVSGNKLYQILMDKWLGRSAYNKLTRQWLYGALARGLTFTWFTLSLLWFWSTWTGLRSLAASLNGLEIAAVWVLVFATATIALALYEAAREWMLSFQFESRPLLASRYVLTVWCTALIVITATTLALLNAPAPDIVYKAF